MFEDESITESNIINCNIELEKVLISVKVSLLLLLLFNLKQSFFTQQRMILKVQIQGTIQHGLLGTGIPHARGVNPTVYLAHWTVRVKQEEETDKYNARE